MISKKEKLAIKQIVDSCNYFSDDGVMDIADKIVPQYSKNISENPEEAFKWYPKWQEAHKIAWDYVSYRLALQDLPENPLKDLEEVNG